MLPRLSHRPEVVISHLFYTTLHGRRPESYTIMFWGNFCKLGVLFLFVLSLLEAIVHGSFGVVREPAGEGKSYWDQQICVYLK